MAEEGAVRYFRASRSALFLMQPEKDYEMRPGRMSCTLMVATTAVTGL